ncbi:MAG: alpha-glucosidase, partial [Rhodobacteraceae bacterium]|nr:alpha-glucosidase [Paracoccaceae bacterium]
MADLKWWETAVIYQIYPRSFQDSNGDGIGDLKGITSRLEYIAELGIDAIWISPFFMSPQRDFGYDISNYCDINPEYGTLADFDEMIARIHGLGMKLMIDIVPAHCSDLHPWFEESRQSRDNPKADWFHWVDPNPDGTVPNNWLSFFGGQAWSWEPRRQQYYLHNFLSEQPNLNHANQEVRDALNQPQQQQPFFRQLHDVAQLNQPAIQTFSENYRKIADEYDGDRFLMGEVDGDKGCAMEVSKTFTDTGRLHATYNFDLLAWGGLSVDGLRNAINNAVDVFNGTGRLCFAFSNHDVPRSATRQLAALGLGPDQSDAMQLLLLKLETCLIGSSCVYQGEELGLEDVTDIPVEQMQDPWGVKFAPAFLGRDTCRTPMVWEKSNQHGGFSTADATWLPISGQHLKRAGLDMAQTDGSIYRQFAQFLAWRKNQPAIMNANTMSAVSGD